MSQLTPKTNPNLFGHEAAEARWQADVDSGKLAHGWIISGPKGIGKATLAYRIARMMLTPSPLEGEGGAKRRVRGGATNSEFEYVAPTPQPLDANERQALPQGERESSIARRIATGAHPDFLVVEPEFDDKKGEQKNSISVEQARGIAEFLSLTPAEGEWRVVIIDSVDQLNTAGANAILKILEEPPAQALLLLISHNPGLLLPTIRSRAAMLKLAPLSDDDFNRAMEASYPDMEPEKRDALKILSGGSPGLAATYEGQGATELYDQMLDVIATIPALDTMKAHAFADQFGGAATHAQFKLFTELALCLFARVAKYSISPSPVRGEGWGGGSYEEVSPTLNLPLLTSPLKGEEFILPKLAALHSPAVWAAKWQQAQSEFSLAIARHLDTKQVVLVFFHSIASSEPFTLGAAA